MTASLRPVTQPADGPPIECQICGRPATTVRPATKNRELAYYCDRDTALSLGWCDTFHRIKP